MCLVNMSRGVGLEGDLHTRYLAMQSESIWSGLSLELLG